MYVVFGFLTVLLSLAAGQSTEGLFELNIVHFNDFHAHFEEVSPRGGVCNPSEDPCIGGFSRLYTAISEAFEAEPHSILLNGGDTFQGTMWYNFLRWEVALEFMNLLPHDAHTIGNHEFDHGVEGLVPYLEQLKAPMLGANVNVTFQPDMQPYIKNHVVIERQGRQIGIIGVLLRTFSAPIGNVIMEDELTAINREAAILKERGIDIIILLSHVGYDADQRLARLVSPDIDVIVGAHSHTLLYTGNTPSGHTPLGQYPTVVTQDNGHRIPIVQAYCYTQYLGVIKLFIDDNGIVQSWLGEPIYLGSNIVKDPHIEELLEPWRQQLNEVGKEVLGRSITMLNRNGCYNQECSLGSWACDGFIGEVMPYARDGEWGGAHVCLINAGGLRVHINPGNVTTESLLMAMPFENYVQLFDLKGEYLLQALEFAVGTTQSNPGNFNSARMLQIGGMRNIYNGSAPVGQRVTATVRCLDCEVPTYLPLDVNAIYRVVTQNYIGDGGGGYSMLADHRTNLQNLKVDYEMLQDYMRKQGSTFQELDERIKIVW